MKYEIYTYCRTEFDTPVINDWHIKNLRTKGIEIGGVGRKIFENENEFLYFVKGYDYVSGEGTKYNQLINAIMCSPNDSYRYRYSFEYGFQKSLILYLGYLVKDETGRIIDLRNYTDKVYKFDYDSYREKLAKANHETWAKIWDLREIKWALDEQLREGKDYWGYYRRMSTTQEIRWASNPENKSYVRGRRSKATLPNSWSDYYFHREKTWKARTKAKRQWLVNKIRHIDTVKEVETADEYNSCYDCFSDCDLCEKYFD